MVLSNSGFKTHLCSMMSTMIGMNVTKIRRERELFTCFFLLHLLFHFLLFFPCFRISVEPFSLPFFPSLSLSHRCNNSYALSTLTYLFCYFFLVHTSLSPFYVRSMLSTLDRTSGTFSFSLLWQRSPLPSFLVSGTTAFYGEEREKQRVAITLHDTLCSSLSPLSLSPPLSGFMKKLEKKINSLFSPFVLPSFFLPVFIPFSLSLSLHFDLLFETLEQMEIKRLFFLKAFIT